MNESIPIKSPTQEQLAVKIEVVEIPTLKDLEGIRKLRLSAAQNPIDAHFLATTLESEQNSSINDFKKMFEDGYMIIAWSGNEAIGLLRIRKEKQEGVWYLTSAFVERKFRNSDIGLKIFSASLTRLLDAQAEKVNFLVKEDNKKMKKFVARLGAQTIGSIGSGEQKGRRMELDLTRPEVLETIKKVLNAR